jgi:regulator of sigma E protease
VPVVVTPGSAAALAGIVSGDRLAPMNGHPTVRWSDILERMEEADGEPVEIGVRGADGALRSVQVAPRPAVVVDYGVVPRAAYTTRRFAWSEAFTAGMHASWNLARQFYLTLRKMLVREVSTKNLGGIVAISNVSYHFAQLGLAKLFFFLALLSVQLAFINVLPIPVLDGGHLLFLGIEKVKGSPVSERVVNYAQVVGLVIVLSLLIYVTFNDINRLLQ